MRVTENEQMTVGEVDISKIRFGPKSRDDISKILRGLQFIYTNTLLSASIFALLNAKISPKVSKISGRPGMTLWNILLCGVIRLDLNCDYDPACTNSSTITTPCVKCFATAPSMT
jgi:IS5 family transposase